MKIISLSKYVVPNASDTHEYVHLRNRNNFQLGIHENINYNMNQLNIDTSLNKNNKIILKLFGELSFFYILHCFL